jgi:glycosyltransferase involved in cell wall biosynthesis
MNVATAPGEAASYSPPCRRSRDVPETHPKLIVVGPSPPPFHGVSVMTLKLIDALRELGAFAGHLDTRDTRPVDTIGRLDIRNVLLGFQHAWQLNGLLRRQPDAAGVHICISQARWGFIRDAVLVGIIRARSRRLYVHLHGGLLAQFYRREIAPMRWLIRTVLGQAYQGWVLTPSLRSQLDGLVSPERVRCIPNVVDDPLAERSRRPPTDDRKDAGPRVLYLSNLLPEKGCFDVLAALRLLGEKSNGWQVRIVGAAGPSVERRLREEIDALPPGSARVTLFGEVTGDDKEAQYRWADVFVYPTRYPPEGQPLVLLEAMAAALPIVTTRQGGIPDTVTHGREGLVVRPGDPQALTNALRLVASDPTLRARMAKRSRQRYELQFRPERLRTDLTTLLVD